MAIGLGGEYEHMLTPEIVVITAIVIYVIGIPIATGMLDTGGDLGDSIGGAFFWPLLAFIAVPFFLLYRLGQWIVNPK